MTIKYWLLALRLQTLPAGASPVIIGLAISKNIQPINIVLATTTLLCALLIQIGTNFANDYYDAKKGADTPQRKGPQRMVQAGLISPDQMKHATTLVFATAFVIGLYLAWSAGWPILIIGIISICCGYLYTASPYAIAYNGLGDIFALVFFGPVAVAGTTYIQTGILSPKALILGVGIGLISTALLAVNNVRDINEDSAANKHTLVVRFGKTFGQIEFTLCLLLSYSILFLYTFQNIFLIYGVLSYGIYTVHIIRKIWTQAGKTLNNCLANTGLCLLLYAIILYADTLV